MTVQESLAGGRLEILRALRDALAIEIDATNVGRAMTQTAPLAKQLRETLIEIEKLEAAEPKGSIINEIELRRAARRSGTEGSVAAGGDGR